MTRLLVTRQGSFLLAVALSLTGPPPAAVAVQTVSLCVVSRDGCDVPGARVEARLELGQGNTAIVGGQFFIRYDPTVLGLIDVAPGGACDPTSPFTMELFEILDAEHGTIMYAVGMPVGASGAEGPATMVCLSFVVLGGATTDICVVKDVYPNLLVGEHGQAVPIDNSEDCPPAQPALTISCDDVEVDQTCHCAEGTPDCTLWDDDCNMGVCNEDTVQCEAVPTNEGGPCDDGNPCTVTDVCIDGVCVGSGCTDPSLCVVTANVCQAVGELNARIELGESVPAIVGGQFSIQYDTEALDFIGIEPGSTCDPTSPFSLEIYEAIDETNGELFYAVGIRPVYYTTGSDPGNDRSGTQGPTTMACLKFAAADGGENLVCLFDDKHPFSTLLVDELGSAVSVYNLEDCPPELPAPVMSCDDVVVIETCECIPGSGDCSDLDTECRLGVCDETIFQCITVPANEGGPCDDGDACTTSDMCVEGKCIGFAGGNPSLCILAGDQVEPGGVAEAVIRLGESDPEIRGGQFTIQYDPMALELIDVEPGNVCDLTSPFTLEIYEGVNNQDGEAFYAVGVIPGDPGPEGATTMACLRFVANLPPAEPICLFNDMNPFSTILVTDTGEAACIYNADDCPIDRALPVISCDEIRVHEPIPAIGEWGLACTTLLLLTVAKICYGVVSKNSIAPERRAASAQNGGRSRCARRSRRRQQR